MGTVHLILLHHFLRTVHLILLHFNNLSISYKDGTHDVFISEHLINFYKDCALYTQSFFFLF